MILLLRPKMRELGFPVAAVLGLIACQEPGADWAQEATTNSSSSASNTDTSSLTTSDGTSAATVTSTDGTSATMDTSNGSGGTGSTTDGGVTGNATSDTSSDSTNDSTSDMTTTSDTTSDTSSTTGSGGTGGGSGNSLITNGDFADGESGWEFSGDGSVDVSSGEYCVTLNNAGTVFVDWPAGIESTTVQGGQSYVFSYILYYSGSVATVSVKIGQPVDPYNAYAEGPAAVTTSPQTFMQSFTMDSDDQVGIRFTIDGEGGTKVCIDDVVLVAQ